MPSNDTYTVQPGDSGWFQIAQKLTRLKGYRIDYLTLQKLNPQYVRPGGRLYGTGTEILTLPPRPESISTSTPGSTSTTRSSSFKLESLTFWLNAFIPNSVCEKKGDLFVIVVRGAPSSRSPLPPLPTARFFTGHQRGFSSNINESARMHSEVTIAGLSSDNPRILTQRQVCGPSHEVDDNGNIIATETADIDRMRFFNFRGSKTADPNGGIIDNGIPGSVQINLIGSAALPLVAFSPDIDYVGNLTIDRWEGSVFFKGAVDRFPAYELYFRANGGPPITLAQLAPITPIGLIGPPNRNVDVKSRIL
ncbi:MAG: DUF3238 domain-containing protein [Acidobacteriia bacterium]|nr:DUF3238 domain-containing protein [Terriglobia bacterium]